MINGTITKRSYTKIMQMQVENGVRVADVAKRLKTTAAAVEAEARKLGCFVGMDWSGALAMSERDAAGLVSGKARQDAEQDQRWQTHLRATEGWEAEREQVRNSAYQETRLRILRQGHGEPSAASVAAQAGQEAAEKFERRHPAPEFDGNATAQSWLRKAGDRIAGVIG